MDKAKVEKIQLLMSGDRSCPWSNMRRTVSALSMMSNSCWKSTILTIIVEISGLMMIVSEGIFAFLLVDESIIKIGGSESILKMRCLLIRVSSSASVLFFVTQQHKVEDVKRYWHNVNPAAAASDKHNMIRTFLRHVESNLASTKTIDRPNVNSEYFVSSVVLPLMGRNILS